MTRDAPGPDAPAASDLPPLGAQHGEDRLLFNAARMPFDGKAAARVEEPGRDVEVSLREILGPIVESWGTRIPAGAGPKVEPR